jgi:hypothetical protein
MNRHHAVQLAAQDQAATRPDLALAVQRKPDASGRNGAEAATSSRSAARAVTSAQSAPSIIDCSDCAPGHWSHGVNGSVPPAVPGDATDPAVTRNCPSACVKPAEGDPGLAVPAHDVVSRAESAALDLVKLAFVVPLQLASFLYGQAGHHGPESLRVRDLCPVQVP